MDADTFTDLALQVLAGNADAATRQSLDRAMEADPQLRARFADLKLTHDAFLVAAPLATAESAAQPELPAYRVNELRTAVRQHFGPAKNRAGQPHPHFLLLRRLWVTGVMAGLALVLAQMFLSDRSVEVGLYRSDVMRGDNGDVTPQGTIAKVVLFDQDAPFDEWQKTLAWNQHAKIWIDNEHDLVHVLYRDRNGKLAEVTEPLAPSAAEERTQIEQAIRTVGK